MIFALACFISSAELDYCRAASYHGSQGEREARLTTNHAQAQVDPHSAHVKSLLRSGLADMRASSALITEPSRRARLAILEGDAHRAIDPESAQVSMSNP
jgi:hypothetical protein